MNEVCSECECPLTEEDGPEIPEGCFDPSIAVLCPECGYDNGAEIARARRWDGAERGERATFCGYAGED